MMHRRGCFHRAVPQPSTDVGGFLVHCGAMLAGLGFVVGFVTEILQLHEEVVGAEDVA
jgi:hypothetical protein